MIARADFQEPTPRPPPAPLSWCAHCGRYEQLCQCPDGGLMAFDRYTPGEHVPVAGEPRD